MSFPWISPSTVESLGWTLIHFVWQGALIALLLKLALVALRKHSASVRYVVAYCAILLMAAGAVGTFSWYAFETEKQASHATSVAAAPVGHSSTKTELWELAPVAPNLRRELIPSEPRISHVAALAGPNRRALLGAVEVALERHFGWIVALWFLGVITMALWLVTGWLRIQSLKRRYVEPALESVTRNVRRLARELGIQRSIRVLQSHVLETPVTFGWLRPIILLPASALAGLSPQQLEAILAHELSHIRRHDYLLNLIQSALETVFFYHPALWWVSRKIRVERENCCDDCAVALCGDRLVYAQALTSLEELRAAPTLAAAATGGSLLGRIRRLVGAPSEVHRGSRWLAGAAVFSSAMAAFVGLSLSNVSGQEGETAANDGPPGVRVLVFPDDRSYGEVHVSEYGSWNPRSMWIQMNKLADARGRVVVPAGKEARLYNRDATDLSGLAFGDLRALDGLYLTGSPLGDAGLQVLSEFRSLKYLTIEKTGISDATLEHIGRIRNLEALNISGNGVTDAGLAQLKNLTKLKKLNLAQSAVTDEGLAHLVNMQELLWARLPGDMTDAGLEHVAKLKSLYKADLGHTKVTDEGLAQLEAMTDLREVILPLHITQQGYDALRGVLPDIEGLPEDVHTLTVHVVDSSTEAPLPRLRVRVDVGRKGYLIPTDAYGNLVLNIPTNASGLSVHVGAGHTKYVPIQASWRESEISQLPDQYTLRLEPGTSIGGVVQDEAGYPIAEAKVYVRPQKSLENPRERLRFRRYRFRTDAQGRWRAEHLPAQVDGIAFHLSHPDYARESLNTPTPTVEELRAMTAVMVMKRSEGTPLSGFVTDEAGNPVAGAIVAMDQSQSYYPAAPTDESGQYRFARRPEGPTAFSVQAKGFAPFILSEGIDAERIDFVLKKGHTVRGRVVDKDGSAILGVSVNVTTWGGRYSNLWKTLTDAEGRFEWDSAPGEAVGFNFYKSGYARHGNLELEPGDTEHVVTLPRPLVVSGEVLDAETGKPIEEFVILTGNEQPEGRAAWWDRNSPVVGSAGKFSQRFADATQGHVLRIVAPGYYPEISEVFRFGEEETTYDFELESGVGPSGVVKSPEGKPLGGVDVHLATERVPVHLDNGKVRDNDESIVVTTGDEGRFAFDPQIDPYAVVVATEEGFAEVAEDVFVAAEGETTVTLEAWGRVEGTVVASSQPVAAADLILHYNERKMDLETPQLRAEAKSRTNDAGTFSFERVIPGRSMVSRLVESGRSMSLSHKTPIEVAAGETATVTVGGGGRGVIGRLPLPEGFEKKQLSSHRVSANIELKQGEIPLPASWEEMDVKAQHAWHREWYVSEAGIAHVRAARRYAVEVEDDGSFRADDVPAGEYTLSVQIFRPEPQVNYYWTGRFAAPSPIASVTHEFEVPEVEGEEDAKPVDLGNLRLEITTHQESTTSEAK